MHLKPIFESKLNAFLMACIASAMIMLPSDANAQGQMPDPPGPEIDILKNDVGEWDVEIKAWSDPNAAPTVTKGTESTRMFGGYWTVTNFEGNMMGMDFNGHGVYGYDTKKKKYIGTWIDSLGPYMMQTAGDYDKERFTRTRRYDDVHVHDDFYLQGRRSGDDDAHAAQGHWRRSENETL